MSIKKRLEQIVRDGAGAGSNDHRRTGLCLLIFAVFICGAQLLALQQSRTTLAVPFSLSLVLAAMAVAVLAGRWTGIIAGVLASLVIDFTTVPPIGRVLNSPASFLLLFIVLFLIPLTLAGVRVLQNALVVAEKERLQAMEAVHARERILSVVAHDLRQPLSAIKLRAALLENRRGEVIGDFAITQLKALRSDVERLDRMIDDLLDFARIDSQQLRVRGDPLDLVGFIESFLVDFRRQNPAWPVVLRFPSRPIVRADADRVRQILNNLFSNAVRYGESGPGIEIGVSLAEDFVTVAVRNSGAGISPEQMATLFECFVRSREARRREATGLGLGLYITKALVEAQSGKIEVQSRLGETTCFSFTLPLATANARSLSGTGSGTG